MADPDLQISGGGGPGHQDPEIRRGRSHTKFFSAPQFGLNIRGEGGLPAPYPGSATDLVLFSIIKVVYSIRAE